MSQPEDLQTILTLKATANPATSKPFTFGELAKGPLAAWKLTGAGLHWRLKGLQGVCPTCYRELLKYKGSK